MPLTLGIFQIVFQVTYNVAIVSLGTTIRPLDLCQSDVARACVCWAFVERIDFVDLCACAIFELARMCMQMHLCIVVLLPFVHANFSVAFWVQVN